MESSSEKTMSPTLSSPSTTPPPFSLPAPPRSPNSPFMVATPQIIMSPCAACKILRRRCTDKCVLAPYFPPTDPLKFTIAHKVFGASNIIKLLQELQESQRADAVSSMVYEANARLRDPIYGCAGVVCQLQKQVNEIQAELAKSRAEMVNMQCQQANLLTLICMQDHHLHVTPTSSPLNNNNNNNEPNYEHNTSFLNFYDDNNNVINSIWDNPLWT